MNRSIVKVIGILFTVAAIGLLGTGCSSTPKAAKGKPYNVRITKTTPASIEVDLIGVSPLEKPMFQGKSIDDYWLPGDPLRKGLVEGRDRLSVQLKLDEPWVLDRKNKIWKTWIKSRGVNELLLIANLPGTFQGGPADPRRLFVPLSEWKGNTIKIEVREAQIVPLTPRK